MTPREEAERIDAMSDEERQLIKDEEAALGLDYNDRDYHDKEVGT